MDHRGQNSEALHILPKEPGEDIEIHKNRGKKIKITKGRDSYAEIPSGWRSGRRQGVVIVGKKVAKTRDKSGPKPVGERDDF